MAPDAFATPTPGCACSRCSASKRIQRSGTPSGTEQMGRVQKFADEQGWGDGANYLRPDERADREEREAYGKQLPAAYRHLIGPAPNIPRGDTQAAKLHLDKILAIIDQGGWTRNECARLYRMRDKWKARASGLDHRFNVVGNRSGGLTPTEEHVVKQRRAMEKTIDNMKRILENAGRTNGD